MEGSVESFGQQLFDILLTGRALDKYRKSRRIRAGGHALYAR
jgi:hypothetical protein